MNYRALNVDTVGAFVEPVLVLTKIEEVVALVVLNELFIGVQEAGVLSRDIKSLPSKSATFPEMIKGLLSIDFQNGTNAKNMDIFGSAVFIPRFVIYIFDEIVIVVIVRGLEVVVENV